MDNMLINNEVERIFAMPFMDQLKIIKLFPNDSPIMAALWKKEIELHGGFKYHYAAKLFEGKKQFHKNGFTTPEFKNFMYGYRTILQKFGYPLEELLKFTLIPAVDAVDVVEINDAIDLVDAINAVEVVDFINDEERDAAVDVVKNPVQLYTTKQQYIEESKILLKKSFTEWLPTQRYPRLLQQASEPVVLTSIDLQTMKTIDLFAFVNFNEAVINRSNNASIRYNVMKGQVIEQLVIRAKKLKTRSKICDIYADVNTSLKNYAIQRGESYVELGDRYQQKLRALGNAAEYLELEKYDYKCTLKELIDRAPQIVKEANSLKPVIEKRPAVCRRAAPAAKKQRVN